ncbi:unnamed protein product [Meloidogyne enterolobii]|uniref:Uncharacterized protein n=1 Tax=Meloidogyne enterolobii TaxID=390850 RepID=A0ACB0YAX4_MELEN
MVYWRICWIDQGGFGGILGSDSLFPNVPGVNTSCTSSKDVIYLFYMKKVYAYVCEHTTGKFNLLDKHPIELQPMIIPFPIKCFPLNNGSLMIGSVSIYIFNKKGLKISFVSE